MTVPHKMKDWKDWEPTKQSRYADSIPKSGGCSKDSGVLSGACIKPGKDRGLTGHKGKPGIEVRQKSV